MYVQFYCTFIQEICGIKDLKVVDEWFAVIKGIVMLVALLMSSCPPNLCFAKSCSPELQILSFLDRIRFLHLKLIQVQTGSKS